MANPTMKSFIYLKNNAKKPILRKRLDASHLNKWNEDEKIKEIKIEGPKIHLKENTFVL